MLPFVRRHSGASLAVDDEGGEAGENVDRFTPACLARPLISGIPHFSSLLLSTPFCS
jgi:hypothetical protein